MHSKIEGTYEYTLLLFIPSRAPFDLWIPQAGRGVKLHIRRVFIMEDSGQLMPQYLRFVRGVIDSSDLPLNVSRELLQGSRVVDNIRSNAVKKVLRLLADMAEKEPEKYATFWKEFGAVLKEGVAEDFGNRDEIARLLRFTSTRSASDEPDVSLADYVGRMKEGQEQIYYLLAPGLAAAKASPHLEAFRKKGIEVLLLGDGEGSTTGWWPACATSTASACSRSPRAAPTWPSWRTRPKPRPRSRPAPSSPGWSAGSRRPWADRACDVRVSSRLTTSPACIVANEPEIDINLARRLRGSGLPSQPVLEINPQHPLVRRLNREPADPRLAEWAHVLFDQAVLTLGARIEEPAAFVSRLNDLLVTLSGRTTPSDQPGPAAGRQRPARVLPAEPAVGRGPAARFAGGLAAGGRRRVREGRGHRVDAADAGRPVRHRGVGARQPRPVGSSRDPVKLRGEERYQHLVAMCRELGVITPEDPYPVWPGPGGPAVIVPLFLLYDYTFRPDGTSTKAEGLDLAYQTGVIGTDERPCTPTRTRAGRRGARRGSKRPCRAWPPSTPICRPSWSATSRSPASPPGSCAIPRSHSGAAPSRPPTGTCASAPSSWSTGTCTSPGPPGRTACASRRCPSATPRSRTNTRPARAG